MQTPETTCSKYLRDLADSRKLLHLRSDRLELNRVADLLDRLTDAASKYVGENGHAGDLFDIDAMDELRSAIRSIITNKSDISGKLKNPLNS